MEDLLKEYSRVQGDDMIRLMAEYRFKVGTLAVVQAATQLVTGYGLYD